MDIVKQKWKKTLISKTWERCKSFGSSSKKPSSCVITKSKSWSYTTKSASTSSAPDRSEKRSNKKRQVGPEGCFSVYVGPEKQRFVIKTELANHPLFKMLLEDAESEYGYDIQGPITLPCDVDLFYKILTEMESAGEEIDPGCSFVKSPLILFSPSRRPNHTVYNYKGYGDYRLLSPSRMMQMNDF